MAAVPEPATIFPPFDLTSDMLFVTTLAPSRWLRERFPTVPFLSVLGRTPLVVWFSTVSEGCYRDDAGNRQCLGGPGERLYHEITVMVVLRKRELFCPTIYATSQLSIHIAGLYAMPKQRATIRLEIEDGTLTSEMSKDDANTCVVAGTRTRGNWLAAIVQRLWPVWSWPVRFPARTRTQALILDTPRVRLARIRSGKLALPVPWLPGSISFLGFGLFIPQLRMQLPPP